jgi:hypothetical protein
VGVRIFGPAFAGATDLPVTEGLAVVLHFALRVRLW